MSAGPWQRATAQQRRDEMRARRQAGATYPQIAEEFGISIQWATKLVAQAAPPLFASERELVERRERTREMLDHDPDVLRCRAEREKAEARHLAKLDAIRADFLAAETRVKGTQTKGRDGRRRTQAYTQVDRRRTA